MFPLGSAHDNGFDAEFLDPLPVEFQCAICHLVYRHPVQLSTCGHRFCHACFLTMEKHYKLIEQPMLCPLDNSAIDNKKVFLDKGIERQILCLPVKCSNHSLGCEWTGELRGLETHLNECKSAKDREKLKIPELYSVDAVTKEDLKEVTSKAMENDKNLRKFYEEYTNMNTELQGVINKMNEGMDFMAKSVKRMETKYTNILQSYMEQEKRLKELETKLSQESSEDAEKKRTEASFKACNTAIANVRKDMQTGMKSVKSELKILNSTTRELKEESRNRLAEKVLRTEKKEKTEKTEKKEQPLPPVVVQGVLNDETVGMVRRVDARLQRLEVMNPFSGFFAWTIADFANCRKMGLSVQKDVVTSCFGFECQLTFSWRDQGRSCATLLFEVKRKTPHTAPYLPFFCDLIISSVAKDGEVLSRRISYPNLTFVKNPSMVCYAEIKEFMRFSRDNKFLDENKLKIFGYFKPFDPAAAVSPLAA